MHRYRVELRDTQDTLITYIDNKITALSWEWLRIGGCGACSFNLVTDYDSTLYNQFQQDYGIRVYIDDVLWYGGYIDRVAPKLTTDNEGITVDCLGYINQLKRVIVYDRTYYGNEIAIIVKSIIDQYVTPQTKVTSTAADYQDTNFAADSVYLSESAHSAISKLAEIAGKREWGCRSDKSFFFKTRDDSVGKYYTVQENFITLQIQNDFNPVVTGIHLEGNEGYRFYYSVTGRTKVNDVIVSNSAIETQSVAQQYARMYLKKQAANQTTFKAKIPKCETRIETTIPLKKAAVNFKAGIKSKYDEATSLYDSGLRYNGGLKTFTIEKVKYTLQDETISAEIDFGVEPKDIAGEFKRLEYELNNERNKL